MAEVGAYVSQETLVAEGESFSHVRLSNADFPQWDQEILDKCLWCACFCSNKARRRPLSRSVQQDIEEGFWLGPKPLPEYEYRKGHRVFDFVCRPDGDHPQVIENPSMCVSFMPLAQNSPRLVALLKLGGGEKNG